MVAGVCTSRLCKNEPNPDRRQLGPVPRVPWRSSGPVSPHSPLLPLRFYAGGSERSGQQIVGPPRKKSPNELVEDLFKGAKEHGAVAVDRTAKSGGESSKPKVRSEEVFVLLFPVPVEAPTMLAVGSWNCLKGQLSLATSPSCLCVTVARRATFLCHVK